MRGARLSLLEWCLVGVGVLFLGTGIWMVVSPRAKTVVYQFYHAEDARPDTHWYPLSAE